MSNPPTTKGGAPSTGAQIDGIADAAPLDERVLDELVSYTSPAFLRESIAVFQASAEKSLSLLRHAHLRGDLLGVERSAHSLRGSSAIIGARGMMRLAAEVEERARAGAPSGLLPLVRSLEDEYARTRAALTAACQRHAAADR